MRSLNYVQRVSLDFSGTLFPHAICLGDADNDTVSASSRGSLKSITCTIYVNFLSASSDVLFPRLDLFPTFLSSDSLVIHASFNRRFCIPPLLFQTSLFFLLDFPGSLLPSYLL
uniref:Uncharacterized protein n=1 Tax=Hippocampus comes TaxID=109280 RepID=A0A3Q2YB27_HIPCM